VFKNRPLTLSERCRALAEECRSKARSFRNEKPRIQQMFQLAADYEWKTKLAEALEESLRRRGDQDASLVSEISQTFVKQSKQ